MLGRQIVTRTRTAGREMSHLSERVKNPDVQKNVWVEFVGLAMENQALNVGQGKPEQTDISSVYLNCLIDSMGQSPSNLFGC